MFSWLIAFACIAVAIMNSDVIFLIAAGLFAIAGNIALHK